MHNRRASCLKYRCTIYYCMLFIAFLTGCAGEQIIPPPPLAPPVEKPPLEAPPTQAVAPPVEVPTYTSFVAVTVKEGDTLSSLASQYLNDSSKDWMIY